jgi:hypothetical protein
VLISSVSMIPASYSASAFRRISQADTWSLMGKTRSMFRSCRIYGVVHLRKVAVIRDLGQEVEVNSGVKRGDQVILNPAVDLADGSKVRAGPRAPQIF